jgi:(1->4)-alpha-D-glucan 1-alpha-D-glucosylmutase
MLAELRSLAELPAPERASAVRALVEAALDGRAKMWVLMRALDLRRRNSELFARGDYVPVRASGARERNLLAYCRRSGESGVLVAAGRMFASLGVEPGTPPLGEAWKDTRLEAEMLPAGARLTDWLTGARLDARQGSIDLTQAFHHLPVAILHYDMRSQEG